MLGKLPWSVLVTLFPTTYILWFRVYSYYVPLDIFNPLHLVSSRVRREQDHARSAKAQSSRRSDALAAEYTLLMRSAGTDERQTIMFDTARVLNELDYDTS